jgi:hypothetical protein
MIQIGEDAALQAEAPTLIELVLKVAAFTI